MEIFDTGMIVCIVICALVAFILFFPFTFWIDAEGDKTGVKVCAKIFKKKLVNIKKSFGKDDESDDDDDEFDGDDFEDEGLDKSPDKLAPEVFEAKDEPAGSDLDDEDSSSKKKKKRPLTSKEKWTILLTPEFDAQAWWAVKCLLRRLLKLFNVKFYNCFVEGIRLDYAKMGQLASVNAFLQSYPYIGAWDFRMDWTGTAELHGECHVRARINICRIIGMIIAFLFFGGITLIRYLRRKSHVQKTNELPELGFIRSKIVDFMSKDED